MQEPTQTTPRERLLLVAILSAYLLLAITYSVVTPIFEASDELWHYPMIKFIADTGGGLPIQDPANVGPWRQEGGQPPLYYYLGALATFWINTDDILDVRRENPHVDNGIITSDGNINLVVHNAEAERFPWQGTALAVHIVRLLSVIMGAGTVYCTYALAKELFPARAEVALSAAAMVAFMPMFLFISGSVNNDNLSNLLSGLLLLMLVRMAKYPDRVTVQSFAAVGVAGGLGLLTKYSVGFLLVLAGVTFFYVWYRRRSWRLFALGTLLAAFLTIVIAGWWYERNINLYGDVTGLNVFIDILGARQVPADLAQLWRERSAFLHGYWGLFGGINVAMAGWAYPVFNTIGLLGLVGLVVYLAQRIRALPRRWATLLEGENVASMMALAWPVIVFVSWAGWASVTWSSQGRLVFSALTAITVWLAAGLAVWIPEQRYRGWVLGAVVAFFLLCAVLTPFAWIAPAYAPPPDLTSAERDALPDVQAIDFAEPGSDAAAMRLLSSEVNTDTVRSGEQIEVTLYWEVRAPMLRNWSVFVHLSDSNGIPAAQRDTYPGVGLLATSDLSPGRTFADRYVVNVPAGIYTPDTLTLNVGLYDYTKCPACERMDTVDGTDQASLHKIALLPASDNPHNVPNPTHVNFSDKAALIGYALDTRSPAPGDTVTLTLYWLSLNETDADYTVFAHVVGADNHIWANGDAWPAGGAAPTSTWAQGDIIEDAHTLTLDPATPPGVYPIEIGFYVQDESGAFARLVIVTGDANLERDFVYLCKIKVDAISENETESE